MKIKANYKKFANCEVRRTSLHKITISSDTNCKFRGPQTTFSFGNFLEGLTEVSERSCTHCTVYYRQRIQVEVSQGKKYLG